MAATQPTMPELRLPAQLEGQRHHYETLVRAAVATVGRFARAHGWGDAATRALPRAVEVHLDQPSLWRRLRDAFGLPDDAPLPTSALAGAVAGDDLIVVTPEAYACIAPAYAGTPGAYVRLLAHEFAHRLHVAVLDGDEDAMGPRWFYEGFAVVASGDLVDVAEPALSELWAWLHDEGPGAYARYGAALRRVQRAVPLPELVVEAGRPDFEAWIADRLAAAPG